MLKDYEEWSVTADLARLQLDPKEIESLAKKAEQMRELFLTMAGADVEALEPTTHALVLGNRIRQDHPENFDSTEKLIEAAPETEDGFFLIPNVL